MDRRVCLLFVLCTLLCLAEAGQQTQRPQRHALLEPLGGERLPIPMSVGPRQKPNASLSKSRLTSSTNRVNATSGQFPWQVSMVMDGANFCGGTIISDTWILTAGYCTDGYRSYVVTVGSLKSFGGSEDSRQLFLTQEAYRHPAYSGDSFYDNDIGLLHLKKAMTLSDAVQAVGLPSYSLALESLKGQQVNVSGWGLEGDGEGDAKIAANLQYETLTIAADSVCSSAYGSVMISSKLCVVTQSNSSTCNGDWGSPLVIQTRDTNVMVGIVSGHPIDACSEGLPIIFTKVTSFLGFIEDTTNIAVSE